mgnify:CR=1 FL=1
MKKRYCTVILAALMLSVPALALWKLPLEAQGKHSGTLMNEDVTAKVGLIAGTIRSTLNRLDKNSILLIKPGSNEFHIYSSLPDNKTLQTRFTRKDWGTWNIGGWYVTDDGNIPPKSAQLLAGGGSDWEYVFRVSGRPDSGVLEFSGGNHGKELLRDLRFIDPVTGAQLPIAINQRIRLKKLKIIEDTSLCLDYNLQKKYADVRRIYTVYPAKITLDTEFRFTSEVYMGTSYVCMLPVTKSNGRNIMFKDTGNIYTTPPEGFTRTSGGYEHYIGNEKTTSVSIWGDSGTAYRFWVWIENSGMIDNFSNKLKVFYWDLNKYGNKLYFSKYDSSSPQKISAGTQWLNRQGWELQVSQPATRPARLIRGMLIRE